MQGMFSFAARTASRAISLTDSRSTPGIEGTGLRASVPSITNNGQIRSSVVRTFSRTMRRAHSLRRFRRMRTDRSSCAHLAAEFASTGVNRVRLSIGRPNLIAIWVLPAIFLTGLDRPRYPPPRISVKRVNPTSLRPRAPLLRRLRGFLYPDKSRQRPERGHRAYSARHSRASLRRLQRRLSPIFRRGPRN